MFSDDFLPLQAAPEPYQPDHSVVGGLRFPHWTPADAGSNSPYRGLLGFGQLDVDFFTMPLLSLHLPQ